jgi:2-dehydro-3-deoxyphosphooctonate aldolase (KDO 8-P synthase)
MIGGKGPLALISGPCVIESRKGCLDLAKRLVKLAESEGIPFVFKASYDKANRTSVDSYRGPGIIEGLEILQEVRETLGVPVTTDVHTSGEATLAAKVVDAIQIPAFLCRQTDLLLAAGETGIPVNIKKGQFLAASDMKHVIAKVESTGNKKIIVTERGASFGYNNLVADMRNLLEMKEFGYPVTFDATHSVQRPGGAGTTSGGDSRWAPYLARAAVAVGCDAVFIETHVNPAVALSDGANAIRFSQMSSLWKLLRSIDDVVS